MTLKRAFEEYCVQKPADRCKCEMIERVVGWSEDLDVVQVQMTLTRKGLERLCHTMGTIHLRIDTYTLYTVFVLCCSVRIVHSGQLWSRAH